MGGDERADTGVSWRCVGRARAVGPNALALLIVATATVTATATSTSLARTSDTAADVLVDERPGVVIDWRRGTIVATAGAAADWRMPSADAARPGAERRAQAAARARIAEALRTLPLGGARRFDAPSVSRAIARARPASVEYQSNGGVVVQMEISFGDWAADAPPDGSAPDGGISANSDSLSVPLWLPAGRLAAAPILVLAGGRELPLGSARYAPAAGLPAGVKPIAVHADKQGRLVVDDAAEQRAFVGRAAVIYVQKILR